jgi:hypothetical protein
MVAGTCHKPDDERSLWMVVVIEVLEPRERPVEKKLVPDRPAENAMVAFSAVMAGRIVDAGMAAGTCHKPDDERSLWMVVVIGVLEPREDPPKKNWSQTGRPKMRWSHFPP